MRKPTGRAQTRTQTQAVGSTAWKIRIDNEDLHFLRRVSQAIAQRGQGLIPEPSITALIQTAIKKYVSEAVQCYEVCAPGRDVDALAAAPPSS